MNINDNGLIKKIVFTTVTTKIELFNELGQIAVTLNVVKKPKHFINALNAREKLGSTGMLEGIAIPHAISPKILKPAILIIKSSQVINDWETLDDSQIKIAICLSMPQKTQTKHLDLLANIAKKLSDQKLRTKLVQTEKEEEIWKILN